MVATARARDPLGPMTYIVKVLSTFFGLWFLARIVELVQGGGGVLGFRSGEDACMETPGIGIPLGIGSTRDVLPHGPFGFPAGVTGMPTTFDLCAAHATLATRLASSLPGMVTLVFFMGFLCLVLVILREARRGGIFTEAVAARLTMLGGYLLVGGLAIIAARALAYAWFIHQLLPRAGWPLDLVTAWPIPVLVAGFGVLTFGRIMSVGVSMQEEIDATV